MKTNILQKYVVPTFLVACLLALAFQSPKADASGDATFQMTPLSGSYTANQDITLAISEDSPSSSDNTNAVQTNISYNPSYVTYVGETKTGPFTNCVSDINESDPSTSGNKMEIIACFSSNSETGVQPFVNVTFSVNSISSTSSTQIKLTTGSDIDNSSGSSVLNTSVALPVANFTVNPPPAPPPQNPSSGSTSGTTTNNTGGSTSTKNYSSTPKTTSPTKTTASSSPTAATTPSIALPTPTSSPTSQSIYGSVSITVTSTNGQPVSNAKVIIGNKVGYTDTSGVVNFAGISSGKHKIIISAPGKKAYTTVTQLAGGQNKFLSYKLASASSIGLMISLIILIVILALGIIAFILWTYRRNHPPSMPLSHLPPVEPPTIGPNIVHPAPTPLSTSLNEP